MKITMVLDLLIEAVSLRSAWLISRACRPGNASPISPSSSARGTSADAERDVEPERARGNGFDIHRAVVLAQLHHRALAELALDLGERGGQGLGLVHGRSFDDTQGGGGHRSCSLWRGFASGTNGRPELRSLKLGSG